jgi:hypothetical protein
MTKELTVLKLKKKGLQEIVSCPKAIVLVVNILPNEGFCTNSHGKIVRKKSSFYYPPAPIPIALRYPIDITCRGSD